MSIKYQIHGEDNLLGQSYTLPELYATYEEAFERAHSNNESVRKVYVPDYTFKNSQGDKAECWGEVYEGQNYQVLCEDEDDDWICLTMSEEANTWAKVAKAILAKSPNVLEIQAI